MADFSKHQIAKSINADLASVMKHPYVRDFMASLDFKSKNQRAKDELLINYLVGKCKFYADGWIKANLSETMHLYDKNTKLDKMQSDLVEIFKEMNSHSNMLIKRLKDEGLIPEDKLEMLRDMEREIQKSMKSL